MLIPKHLSVATPFHQPFHCASVSRWGSACGSSRRTTQVIVSWPPAPPPHAPFLRRVGSPTTWSAARDNFLPLKRPLPWRMAAANGVLPRQQPSHGGSRRRTTSSFGKGSSHNAPQGAPGPPPTANINQKLRPRWSQVNPRWPAAAGPSFRWLLPCCPHLRKKERKWGVKQGEAEGDGGGRGRAGEGRR